MTQFMAVYLGGWLIVALVAVTLGVHFRDLTAPAPRPLLVSALAGAIWPLILLGVAEIGAEVAYAKAFRGLTRQSPKQMVADGAFASSHDDFSENE